MDQINALTTTSVSKEVLKRLHSSQLSANVRAKMAGNEDFFEENNELICKFCWKVIDHTRQGSVDRHEETVTHTHNKKNPKLQETLQTAFTIGTTA